MFEGRCWSGKIDDISLKPPDREKNLEEKRRTFACDIQLVIKIFFSIGVVRPTILFLAFLPTATALNCIRGEGEKQHLPSSSLYQNPHHNQPANIGGTLYLHCKC
jgi:hypothetical protein